MKKTLYSLLFAAAALAGCDDDNLPEASFDLFQVTKVTAVAGDESAIVEWAPQAGKPAPTEYYVTWTADDPDVTGGSESVAADILRLEVTGLVNDCAYTFTVQSRYADGLAMKVSAVCTPKTTRFPVTDMKAMAGDSRAYITWTAPDTQLPYSYRLVVETADAAARTVEVDAAATSCLVDGLTNGTQYTFTMTCIYAHGLSESASVNATPGQIDPITVTSTSLRQFELCTFEYNPAYFVSGEIAAVAWDFGNGDRTTDAKALYCYPATGDYTVTLTVTYADGTFETASVAIRVDVFAWSSVAGVGYQKSSAIVFSVDGQTLYTASQTDKKLFAIHAVTGEIRWSVATAAATYGAGPAVGADGMIYFGTEDDEGSFYAITPAGVTKWSKQLGGKVKASPAVTSEGVVYALTDGGRLYALNAATGNEKWSAVQSGNAGGVVVDRDGTVLIGTSTGIWAYTAEGSLKWACDTAHAVTERGGSLALNDGILYATLKSKGGCAAVDTSTGKTLWTSPTTLGDCYHPVVDADGTVYFCEKSGYLYAVDKSGATKWSDQTDKNYIYSGFALGADGKAYISQYASPFGLLSFDRGGSRTLVTTIGAQTMSPVSIGPDRRIYYMTNGTITALDAGVELAGTGWPMRGGNRQGNNSLK